MSEEREQRLVDLAFIIGQACSMPALAGAGQERVCAYVSALLAELGFETEPTEYSHGILKPAKTAAADSRQGDRREDSWQ